MKFKKLIEANEPAETLDDILDKVDATFYQDHGDLYYFDGEQLKILPEKLKYKIYRKYYSIKRAKDASNDPSYDPDDLTDYRNRLKQVEASFKNRQNLGAKLLNDKTSDINKAARKQNQQNIKSADKFKLKNYHSYSELEASLNLFLAEAAKRAEMRKKWSGTGRQLDPRMATEVKYYKPEEKKVPSIFLYFDRSYSWNDAQKTRIGYDIVSTLTDYDERGLIDMKQFYFGTIVTTNEADAGKSTNYSVENVINHIKEFTPDNVIIITDSDSSERYMANKGAAVTVPGTAWLISVLAGEDTTGAIGLARHINGGDDGTKTYEFKFKV